jgi:PAS domain S-box-containing protein
MKRDTNHQQSSENESAAQPVIQRNQHKNAAGELEKRLQRALHVGRIFSWEMNPATRKLEWSDNMEEVIGFPLLDNIDKTFELIHPDDVRALVDTINEAIATGSEYESEYRLVNPANGEELWFHSQGAMTTDTADGLPRFTGITQNITERKCAEKALRESEAKYRTLFDSMDEGYILVDVIFDETDAPVDILYVEANAAAVRMTGVPLVGRRTLEIDPNFEPHWFETFGRVARTGIGERHEFTAAPLGVWYNFYVFKTGDQNKNRVAAVYQDITRRKQNEEALRSSEAQIATDLAGMRRLYELQSKLADQNDVKAALRDVLAVACEFTGTDRGCVQMLSDDGKRLEMSVWQGYADDSPFIEFFRYEGFENGCEVTRIKRQRLIIEETIGFEGLDGTDAGAATYAEGIRAAQSTPITSRAEETIGVISTQFRQPHRPSDHELRLMDMLAWTAAEFLERHRANAALRESEQHFRLMANAVPQIVWLTDPQGRVEFFNKQWSDYTGVLYEPATAAEVAADFVHPDDAAATIEAFTEAQATGETFLVEHRIRSKAGDYRWFLVRAEPYRDLNTGEIIRWFGASVDIHDRKQAEEDLRESEERMSLILKSVEDYAIITTDTAGVINGWNSGAEKTFGYTASEIVGQNVEILFTPEDRKKGVAAKEMQTAATKGSADDERFHMHRDGSRFYVSGVMHPLKDGKIEGFVKIARDMTSRIKAEKLLLDKEILQRLVSAQEDERKRIARDLHDELGQQIIALRLKLDAVRILGEADKELSAGIADVQIAASKIDAGVDFLTWELRPSILDDLGLSAALEKYVKEWSQHAGVSAEFIDSGKKGTRFPTEIEINLYRIVQEALNNVHKHSKAQKAGVILDTRDDSIVLIIEDDGVGFEPENKKTRSKGLGLLGMQERAALIIGTVEIESKPKMGTTVYIRVSIESVKDILPTD